MLLLAQSRMSKYSWCFLRETDAHLIQLITISVDELIAARFIFKLKDALISILRTWLHFGFDRKVSVKSRYTNSFEH